MHLKTPKHLHQTAYFLQFYKLAIFNVCKNRIINLQFLELFFALVELNGRPLTISQIKGVVDVRGMCV